MVSHAALAEVLQTHLESSRLWDCAWANMRSRDAMNPGEADTSCVCALYYLGHAAGTKSEQHRLFIVADGSEWIRIPGFRSNGVTSTES